MIEMTNWIWFAVGLLGGCLHATMLWQGVNAQSEWSPLMGILRVGLVASLLVVAAFNGAILASASGWAVGFAVLATCLLVRRSSTPTRSSTSSPGESG